MELFLQQVFNGIMLGSTYAIVALGLTLVYGILHVPNFAHGHMYMLGAYVAFFLITIFGFAYWPAVALAAIILAVAGVVLYFLVYRPLGDSGGINPFIAALGALIVLENAVVVLWGPEGHRIPNPYPGIIDFFGITMTQQRVLVIVVAFIMIAILQLFIKKTTLGSTIEAVAQNKEGATLVGINVTRVAAMTFAIATALAAIAACLVAPIFMISPSMGAMVGLKSFVIVILGGMGSIPGAIVGGLLLGLIEAIGGGYLSAAYKDVFGFGALVLILAIKPTGLFGKEIKGR
ncbi:MAG: branched-chain amino acid ABC transporter permease [Smithellaceae bacterium]